MAKFDISGSSSRQTGLGQQDRNNAIRMEFEPYTKPPEQTARIEPMSEYVKPPTAPEQQPSNGLPLPLQTVESLFLARRFAVEDAPTPPVPGLYLLYK